VSSSRLREAVALLRDTQLEWSDDFEAVRAPLADLLVQVSELPTHQLDDAVDAVVSSVLDDDFERVELDALEKYLVEVCLKLGVIQASTRRSRAFREAIVRLFNEL